MLTFLIIKSVDFQKFLIPPICKVFVADVEYVFPVLVRAQFIFDSEGKFRFQLSRKDIQPTPRLRLKARWNTDKEYMAGFRYILRKWLALSTKYYSDMG